MGITKAQHQPANQQQIRWTHHKYFNKNTFNVFPLTFGYISVIALIGMYLICKGDENFRISNVIVKAWKYK